MRTIAFALLFALAAPALAQEGLPVEPAQAAAAPFDTSYTPSASVSYRVKRSFLDEVYRSAGADARAAFQEQFDARPPDQIWQELVAPYGLSTGNVADAMAGYWMLNWLVANAAFTVDIQAAPVRLQLAQALSQDASFHALTDDQRQAMAERLMLDFLVLHAAMNTSLRNQDTPTLQRLARDAVVSFRQGYGVDLLTLVPGPNGLVPRTVAEAPAAPEEPAVPEEPEDGGAE